MSAGAATNAMNILSVDVEDWYELSGRQIRGTGRPRPDTLARQLDRLIELLARHRCRATFFCLAGSLAAAPRLVQRIADAGHEIATHGWGHEPIRQVGLDAFRDDLRRSIDWLQDLLGRPIRGHRAPAFSVAPQQLARFYEICLEADLSYDSSVFPIRGRRYGIPDARVEPHLALQRDSRRLFEIPLATIDWAGRRWPVAGGGYWRVLPVSAILRVIERLNHDGRPMVTYLHPYEFDAAPLSAFSAAGLSPRSIRHHLAQNLNRGSMPRKLDRVLGAHRFVAMEDYLREHAAVEA